MWEGGPSGNSDFLITWIGFPPYWSDLFGVCWSLDHFFFFTLSLISDQACTMYKCDCVWTIESLSKVEFFGCHRWNYVHYFIPKIFFFMKERKISFHLVEMNFDLVNSPYVWTVCVWHPYWYYTVNTQLSVTIFWCYIVCCYTVFHLHGRHAQTKWVNFIM